MSKKDLNVRKHKNLNLNKKSSLIYSNFKLQLEKTIKKKSFLVAVSGGPDSLALAALSFEYSLEKKSKAYFVIIDHGIRKNSKKEAIAVKNLLKKKKIKLIILTNQKKINKNIQSNAREIRYKLLLNFCLKHKIKYITTGHHRDDQIETFLIRLSRGSGVQGLSSMNKLTNLNLKTKLFRPLLNEKKQNLIFLAKYYFGKIFKDPSNINQKYLRTKIRNLVKQFEKSGIRHDRVISSINNLASTRDTLNNYIQKVEKTCVIKKKNKIFINLKKFNLENEEVKLKVFSNCIKNISKNYYPPRAKKVLNLLCRIHSIKILRTTLGGCVINRDQYNLVICKEEIKNG